MTSGQTGWYAAVIAGLILLPLGVTGDYVRHLLVLWMIFAVTALSLNLIMGYLGELSFGHAAFFGLGGYASALVALHFGVPFWGGVVMAAAVSGVAGLVIGYIALRIKGPQFAILTLAVGAILYQVVNHWVSLTRGPMGLTKIPPPPFPRLSILPAIDFSQGLWFYYLALAFVLFTAYFTRAVLDSRTGRAFLAVRDNDALAAALGVNVFRTKLVGFVMATVFAGIGGSLYAHYLRVITPELFGLDYIVALVIMVIVGGQGTVAGPIIGAAVYVGLLEWLRFAGALRLVLFGVLLAVCVIFLPGGLASFWRDLIAPRLPRRLGRRLDPATGDAGLRTQGRGLAEGAEGPHAPEREGQP
jgi:branched-chain amino acid transport system permease protein